MSALTDFLTQPGFGWGAALGAVVGLAGPLIAMRSTRKSDERTTKRENSQSRQKLIREAATAFGEVCSAVIEKALDPQAIFNAVRDANLTAAGMKDEKEVEKLEFATDLINEMTKITAAYNNLRLVAPVSVLEKASALNAAMIALTQATTMPLARPPLMKECGRAFDDYTNAVRAELDLEAFTPEDAARGAQTYMETLKSQVDAYMEETKAEAKRLGLLDVDSDEFASSSDAARSPGTIGVTLRSADDLTASDIGKFVGCHDAATGFMYGAKILELDRDETSHRPGVVVKLDHPPIPGSRPRMKTTVRFRFDQEVRMLDLPVDLQDTDG